MPLGSSSCRAEKTLDGREEVSGLLDVRNMATVFEHDKPSIECTGGVFRRCERDRVLSAMNDEGRHVDSIEHAGCHQVELAKTLPNGLLYAPGDAKRGQIARIA